jgi:hypothetical protein
MEGVAVFKRRNQGSDDVHKQVLREEFMAYKKKPGQKLGSIGKDVTLEDFRKPQHFLAGRSRAGFVVKDVLTRLER